MSATSVAPSPYAQAAYAPQSALSQPGIAAPSAAGLGPDSTSNPSGGSGLYGPDQNGGADATKAQAKKKSHATLYALIGTATTAVLGGLLWWAIARHRKAKAAEKANAAGNGDSASANRHTGQTGQTSPLGTSPEPTAPATPGEGPTPAAAPADNAAATQGNGTEAAESNKSGGPPPETEPHGRV